MKRFHAITESFLWGKTQQKIPPQKNKTRTLTNWKSVHNGTDTIAMKAAWMSHQIVGREWKLLIFLSLKSKEELLARGILSRIWLTNKQRWNFQLFQQSIFLILKSLLKVPILLPLQFGGILPKKAELGTNEELPPLPSLFASKDFLWSFLTNHCLPSEPPSPSTPDLLHLCTPGSITVPFLVAEVWTCPQSHQDLGHPELSLHLPTPQSIAAAKVWQNPSNKMNQFILL